MLHFLRLPKRGYPSEVTQARLPCLTTNRSKSIMQFACNFAGLKKKGSLSDYVELNELTTIFVVLNEVTILNRILHLQIVYQTFSRLFEMLIE